MKTKYHYTIKRESDGQWNHIHLALWKAGDNENCCENKLFTMSWQGDSNSSYWYGLGVAFDHGTSFSRLNGISGITAEASKLLGKISAAVDKIECSEQPLGIIDAIMTLGIYRMINDDREDGFVSPSDVKGPEFSRWMAVSTGGCLAAVVAKDEDEARKLLFARMSKEVVDSGYGIERFKNWIKDGEQVRKDTYRRSPDVKTLAEICKPMKEPEPVVLAETVAA